MVEREPITVIVTRKGWIRALKGHVQDLSNLAFKGDDGLKTAFFTETTARVLLLASNGKVFTLEAAKLPGGRGFGDPIRLSIDLEESADFVAAFPYRPGEKRLFASSDGRGFIAPMDDVVALTRKGRQVMNLDDGLTCVIAEPVDGDHLAVIGENRKLLCFPLDQVPEMGRGKGVRLQKYKDGGISDLKSFRLAEGLTWLSSDGRTYTVGRPEIDEWIGARAEAGRLPPKGFRRATGSGGEWPSPRRRREAGLQAECDARHDLGLEAGAHVHALARRLQKLQARRHWRGGADRPPGGAADRGVEHQRLGGEEARGGAAGEAEIERARPSVSKREKPKSPRPRVPLFMLQLGPDCMLNTIDPMRVVSPPVKAQLAGPGATPGRA